MNFKNFFFLSTGIACLILTFTLVLFVNSYLKRKIIDYNLQATSNIFQTRIMLLQFSQDDVVKGDFDQISRITGVDKIIHIRAYSNKGKILWTAPEILSTEQIGDDPDVQEALRGERVARVLSKFEVNRLPFDEKPPHIAKIVVDVHSPSLIQEGVLVVYRNIDFVYKDIRNTRYLILLIILGLFTIFFLVLYIGANRVSQEIINQAESLRKSAEQLETSYRESLQVLAGAIEARTPYATGHSQRVALYATEVAKRFSLKANEIDKVRFTCLLQNIGLVRIPDAVLQKNGKLEADELNRLKRHPVDGAELIQRSPTLRELADAVKAHHERVDGTGYPEGLVGEQIPLEARIVAAADAYVAMTTKRPWRDELSREEAIAELRKYAGTQFDLKIVDMLIQVVREIPERRGGEDRRIKDWGPTEGEDRRSKKDRREV